MAVSIATLLPCPTTAQRLELPSRPPSAVSGTEFARAIEGLGVEARDDRIVSEILQGNVPEWLRDLSPVRIGTVRGGVVEIRVTPDYLAVGSDSDYLLVPMTPQAAQRIADELEMSLPTPVLVDAIWAGAVLKLNPEPIPPSPEMTTVPVFLRHSLAVRSQRERASTPMGSLVSGHKKDIVVCQSLASNPGRVAIYGWHKADGEPIQPLYLGHTDRWVDYSHGVRLVSRAISVGGETMDLWDALRDPALARLLSREGVLDHPWYPWR
ncbi:MAG: hypothetical protein P8170_17555 [Gemmatimonadota bacterium]